MKCLERTLPNCKVFALENTANGKQHAFSIFKNYLCILPYNKGFLKIQNIESALNWEYLQRKLRRKIALLSVTNKHLLVWFFYLEKKCFSFWVISSENSIYIKSWFNFAMPTTLFRFLCLCSWWTSCYLMRC